MATHDTSTTPSATFTPPHVPPLENGDRLTRDEFERRYAAMPHLKKAELLEGVVHMAAALRWNQHAEPHAAILGCLTVYRANTRGVRVGDNSTIRLDLENEPQPDVVMIIDPACGGQARISADDYVEGAPELVAEVSSSSVSIDLNTKLRIYRRNGVREYIVWRVLDQAIDWFVLRGSDFERLTPEAGVYESEVFPGLWLAAEPLTRLDLVPVLANLQLGLASPEHAAFVARLQASKKP